jgi:hypothetical protein
MVLQDRIHVILILNTIPYSGGVNHDDWPELATIQAGGAVYAGAGNA